MAATETTPASPPESDPPPAWPRQLRLPGQAAAPDGPVDLFMMYLLHHAFRRDLARFAAAVPRTAAGDRAAWRRLATRWSLLSQALHHHHEVEDRWLWPALLERASADERRTLQAMAAEHEDIDPLLESVAAGLDALAAGAEADVRAALSVRLVAARQSLGRHLAHEETDAMRILQARLTALEWHDFEARFGEGVGPRQVLAMVPWAAHGLPGHQRAEVLSRGGRVYRVLWRLTRRRFGRREARVFGAVAGQNP